jgi:2'-5' RNA ligase
MPKDLQLIFVRGDVIMEKIAINITLIPEKEIIHKAIQINKSLTKNNIYSMTLSEKDCVPHISLCMGIVTVKNLEKIHNIVKTLLSDYNIPSLEIKELKTSDMKNGDKVTNFLIEENKILSQLHDKFLQSLNEFLSYDSKKEMFVNPSEINKTTIRWVNKYQTHYEDPKKFHPHITLGFGETKESFAPTSFKTEKIAIFQLGNNCTCRKLLYEIKL